MRGSRVPGFATGTSGHGHCGEGYPDRAVAAATQRSVGGRTMATSREKPCVVIVGAGFAGYNAARELCRLIGSTTDIVVINSTDYFLYLPLMPQAASGQVEPRHIRVSLPDRMTNARFVLATVNRVDARQRVVSWEGPEGSSGEVAYDRLILAAGSVNKL